MAIGPLLVSILSIATTPLQDATTITGYVENAKLTNANFTLESEYGILVNGYIEDFDLPLNVDSPYYAIDFSASWITSVEITGIKVTLLDDRIGQSNTFNVYYNNELINGFDVVDPVGAIILNEYFSEPLRFRPGDNMRVELYDGIGFFGVDFYGKINFEIPIDDYANISYEQGFNTGYNKGLENGYNTGFLDGSENGKVGFSLEWLKEIFSTLDSFLQIEIFPNFRLWYCIGAPLMISLVLGFLKLLR